MRFLRPLDVFAPRKHFARPFGGRLPAAGGLLLLATVGVCAQNLDKEYARGGEPAAATVTAKAGIGSSLLTGKGEAARIPIVVGGGGASGNRWWSAEESGAGTLLTPNDLALESGFEVKDITWFKQWDTLAIHFWGGPVGRSFGNRTASTYIGPGRIGADAAGSVDIAASAYFGPGGPGHGKSIFVFDGERGYEFPAAAASMAGGGFINWVLTPVSPAAAFLDGKTEGAPMLIVIADRGAFPTLAAAAPAGQVAQMDIATGTVSTYNIGNSHVLYAPTISTLAAGSDDRIGGAMQIRKLDYHADTGTIEMYCVPVEGTAQTARDYFSAAGEGASKSLYFASDESFVEVPYAAFQPSRTSLNGRTVFFDFEPTAPQGLFLEALAKRAGAIRFWFLIADPGQKIVTTELPPTAQLTASPLTVERGRSAVLTWSTTNARSAAIDNGVGAIAPVAAGSASVAPTETTTYTLTATGAEGISPAAASAGITVTEPGATARLTVSPSRIERGRRSAALSWRTTNAQSIAIDNGVGAVKPSGSTAVNPTKDTTYRLTATGAEGTPPAAARAKVTVVDPPQGQPTVDFFAGRGSAGSYLFEWNVSNTERIVIDSSSDSGSPIISRSKPEAGAWSGAAAALKLSVPTVYTLTAYGGAGATPATASIAFNPDPSIEAFTASAVCAVSGGAVTLSWETRNALSLSIDNGVGAVKPVAAGSVTARPTKTTTYTLSAMGAGGTAAARATVTVKVCIETSLAAGRGEAARIPIEIGAAGDTWWSAEESNAGTLLTPNDLMLESDLAVKDISWSRQADTLGIGFWSGSSTRPVSSRGAADYFGPGGPGRGKSIFVFDGERGYEFGAAAASPAGRDRIHWRLGSASQAAAFLDGKAQGAPMLIVIADTGAYPALPPAVELPVGPSMPEMSGQLARMEIRNAATSANRPYIIFQTHYGGTIPSDLLWADAGEVGGLQYGSDALAQGTNRADRIFYLAYHADAGRVEVQHLGASRNNREFWAFGGAGHNKSLYFCRVPGGSDFAGASCIEAPYSTLAAAGRFWTRWNLASGGARGAFMSSIERGDTVVFAIADPGQAINPTPTAQLTALASTILRGHSTQLTWSTTNAQSAAIDNGVGAVAPVAAGSVTVAPAAATTYTLTATGATGTATAAATVKVRTGVDTWLAAGKGETARIPIVVGNGGVPGDMWWSAEEGVGTLLTPNDLELESGFAVKHFRGSRGGFIVRFWDGAREFPIGPDDPRRATQYFTGEGAGAGKSVFVFDGERGYEFAASAIAFSNIGFINWSLPRDSSAGPFLEGKTEGTPMLIVIADTGAYPALPPAVE